MTNIQAAIGLAQLEKIDGLLAIRRKNATHYNRRLAGVRGLTLPPQAEWATNVYWMYSVLVDDDFGLSRDALRQCLYAAGIDTRPFFYPVHALPMYNTGQSLPVAEDLGRRGLNLPSGATLTTGQIDYICDTLIEVGRREKEEKGAGSKEQGKGAFPLLLSSFYCLLPESCGLSS